MSKGNKSFYSNYPIAYEGNSNEWTTTTTTKIPSGDISDHSQAAGQSHHMKAHFFPGYKPYNSAQAPKELTPEFQNHQNRRSTLTSNKFFV